MKDRDVNFFRPLWRRVAVTAVCVTWAGLELFGHDQTWMFITLGLTAYAVWTLFIKFPKDGPVVAGTPSGATADSVPPPPDGESNVPPQA
jgi:hypothetical protein